MIKNKKNRIVNFGIILGAAVVMRFWLIRFLDMGGPIWLRIMLIVMILVIGAGFVLKGMAEIVEETTGVLSKRTKLAGGMLQSFGTAFPDMALGVVAAIVSLRLVKTDYLGAVNFAIIAAATTFGSNIYNIGYAIWAIFRQNTANALKKQIKIIPFLNAGMVTPINDQKVKPNIKELNISIRILTVLTLLTAVVAGSMVIFGKIKSPPLGISGDLYQLIKPAGIAIFLLCVLVMWSFRKNHRPEESLEIVREEKYFEKQSMGVIFLYLFFAGVTILFAAEAMVNAISVLCVITGLPTVVAGVMAGLIGCLGEIITVHNFTVNPEGRLGDAVVGVAMDNVVTMMGASIVAMMGGIFLGGTALILIFVFILTLNTMLIEQISKLKDAYIVIQ